MGGLSMISLLLPARKDSKWLAHFLMAFLTKTKNFDNVELLILTPKGEWNKDLLEYFAGKFKLYDNTTGLGKGGSNIFWDMLAKKATGDWLMYVCDDWKLLQDYDEHITNYINENNLDPEKLHVITDYVDNSGRVSHILSRKFYETIGFGPHGNIDSCINDTLELFEVWAGKEEHDKVLHLLPHFLIHDYSLDPDYQNLFVVDSSDRASIGAQYKSQETKDKILENSRKLLDVVRRKL